MFFFSRRRRLHPLSLCLTPNWLKFEVLYLVPNWRVCLLISWMTSSRAISVSSVQKPSSWCFWIAGINVSCANKASAPNAFPRYVHMYFHVLEFSSLHSFQAKLPDDQRFDNVPLFALSPGQNNNNAKPGINMGGSSAAYLRQTPTTTATSKWVKN